MAMIANDNGLYVLKSKGSIAPDVEIVKVLSNIELPLTQDKVYVVSNKVLTVVHNDEAKYGNVIRIGTHLYPYIKVGNHLWLTENLTEYPDTGLSWLNQTHPEYGRLYTWDAAISLETNGWRLPSTSDWDALFANTGTSVSNLKSEYGWTSNSNGNDKYMLSVFPAGYYASGFNLIGSEATFWTSVSVSTEKASTRIINSTYSSYDNWKAVGFSVRLCKDA